MMQNSRPPISCVRAANLLHSLSCLPKTAAADPAAACQSPALLPDVAQAGAGRAGVDLAVLAPRDNP